MYKLFKNCYKMDEKCYISYALSEDILMEHAAIGVENYIRKRFKKVNILIVCGAGNNGADGIALARLLHKDYKVYLYLPFGVKSKMAKLQLQRANAIGVKVISKVKKADIVIDAIFGAGLNRELNSQSIDIIKELNRLKAKKIACDIPSGISESGVPMPVAFKADITLTMGARQLSLYSDLSKDYVGKIKAINLGVSAKLYEDSTNYFLLQKRDYKAPLRVSKNSNKGTFGHLAVYVGAKEGAGIISAMAATRFGAGLTTLIYHEKIIHPPHLMSATKLPKKLNAIVIGMGLGEFFEDSALDEVVESNTPIVLDADALYKPKLLAIIEQKREIVITPHPKEFSAILKILENRDISVIDIQKSRLELAKNFSLKYPNVTLLLKGANTLIAKNGKVYINNKGSNILSKGGSGDVLSGLIAALLAQNYSALDAAINGSLALTLNSKKYSGANYSLIPLDIIDLVAQK